MTSGPTDGANYHFDGRRFFEDEWLKVWDGGLTEPIWVRFQVVAGRARIFGLRWDGDRPLGARQLREPRLPMIEDALTSYIQAERDDLETIQRNAAAGGWKGGGGMRKLAREWQDEFDAQIAALGSVDPSELQSRGPGAAAPSVDDYRKFAKVYLQMQRDHPHNHVNRVAEQFGMHRTTVYRWAKECRRLGIQIEPKEH